MTTLHAVEIPVVGSLAERAMLVRLTIHSWDPRRSDPSLSQELAHAHNASADTVSAAKYLIDPKTPELLAVNQTEGAIRSEHKRRTLAWLDDGARILSSQGYFEYVGAMRTLTEKREDVVATFLGALPRIVNEAKTTRGNLVADDEYPTAQALAGRFGVENVPTPVPVANDWRLEGMNQSDMRRLIEQAQAEMAAVWEQAIYEVCERIIDVVGHMADRLEIFDGRTGDSRDGFFLDSLVTNVEDLANLIPSLNVTGSPMLTDLGNRMKSSLCRFTAKDLRKDELARAQTRKAADDVMNRLAEYLA